MFKGVKLADGEQLLSAAGVSEGDKLNIVPGRASRSAASDDKASAAAKFAAGDSDDEDEAAVTPPPSMGGGSGAASAMSSALSGMSDSDKVQVNRSIVLT